MPTPAAEATPRRGYWVARTTRRRSAERARHRRRCEELDGGAEAPRAGSTV